MGLPTDIKALSHAVLHRNAQVDGRLTKTIESQPRVNQILEIKTMVNNFGQRDPQRGCWEYIQNHHPSLWRDHMAALREIDTGYVAKDAGRVLTAKGNAMTTFVRMVETWQGANVQMTLMETV